jgi:hypothetical protein
MTTLPQPKATEISKMQRTRLKKYRWYLLDSVQLAAIALMAVALMSAGAHVFDMSSNLSLKQEDYVILQTAHHGWALFAGATLLSTFAIGFHGYLVRGNSASLGWSIAALVLVCLSQLMFWVVAFPIDAQTAGWTIPPVDFDSARLQWEYAFAGSGVLSFIGLLALVRSIEASRPVASMAIIESIERDAAVRAARMRALSTDGGIKPLERARRPQHRAA